MSVQADDGARADGVGRLTQGFALDTLRTMRRMSIRGYRFVRRGVRYSATWALTALGLLLAGALASAIDFRLVALWRERGARLASEYALIGMIVFFRLLLDRRLPQWTRLVIFVALLYGIARPDLIDDRITLVGWLDDAALTALASRWFVRRCPDRLVEEQAFYVRRRSAGALSTQQS
jgi:uncharacterized membrane protein YkvA (DUF1232 family)